jgi:hypothetical protein
MKDVEILLPGFVMLIEGDNYAPSMVKFLNQFSRKARSNGDKRNRYVHDLLISRYMSNARISSSRVNLELRERNSMTERPQLLTASNCAMADSKN